MIKHTPGPLFVDNGGKYSVRIVDAKGECVDQEPRAAYCSKQKTAEDVMTGRYMGKDKAAAIEANARQLADMRLRASGPDLLAVAERFIAEYEKNEEDEWSEEFQDLAAAFRAAIAKATRGLS